MICFCGHRVALSIHRCCRLRPLILLLLLLPLSLSIDMLSRSMSIFHIGDLGEDGGVSAKGTVMSSRGLLIRCINKPASDEVEGLRILINQRDEAANNNVVIKASLKARNKLSDCHLPRGLPDFLTGCCLCKKELSPGKDVYMYRGDQGFCSKQCRSRQILIDERREFEMAARKRSRVPRHRPSSPKILESDRYRRIPALLT